MAMLLTGIPTLPGGPAGPVSPLGPRIPYTTWNKMMGLRNGVNLRVYTSVMRLWYIGFSAGTLTGIPIGPFGPGSAGSPSVPLLPATPCIYIQQAMESVIPYMFLHIP